MGNRENTNSIKTNSHHGIYYKQCRYDQPPLLINTSRLKSNNRYNNLGEGALCLADSVEGMLHEFNIGGYNTETMSSWEILVKIDNIIDLTDPGTRKCFGVALEDLVSSDDKRETRRVSSEIKSAGYAGLYAPSSNETDNMLVIFSDDNESETTW